MQIKIYKLFLFAENPRYCQRYRKECQRHFDDITKYSQYSTRCGRRKYKYVSSGTFFPVLNFSSRLIYNNLYILNDIFFKFTVIAVYCTNARGIFEDVRIQYANLAEIIPSNQYYRYHDQWRFVTQRLCFLVALVIYLEVKVLVTKDTVAEILGGI